MSFIIKHKQIVLLFLVVALAVFLRFYKLNELPALNADEAALGYNAYSLLKTGRDEHGNSWPLYFQSFNDYKPGFTVYLIMPMVYLFGLTEWSVRFLPALIGVLTVPTLYLFAKELVKESKNTFIEEYLPLISALLLAASPWHIQFSRGAWEVNIATFFMLLASLLFLKIRQKPALLVASVSFFVLSLYTYHAARIVSPLLGLALTISFYSDVFKHKKVLMSAMLVGFVLCIPLLLSLKGPAGLARADGVAIWSDSGPENRVNELRGDYNNMNGFIPKLLHNKPIAYSLAILSNWSKHYWGEFLFLSGDDIQRNKVPETGQLHLIELIFVVFGLYKISQKINKKWGFVLFWLLISPLPAAITFQSPHALRAENMVIPLVLISAYGFSWLLSLLYTSAVLRKSFVLFASILFLLYAASVARYVHMYYVHMTKEYPFSSQYGVKELVQFLSNTQDKYEQVIVTDRYDQPYILFLFYMKYDPATFQKDHTLTTRDLYGFSTVRSFSNFRFESIHYVEFRDKDKNSLIIGTNEEIPETANIIKDIYGTNGYRYFRVVEN